MQHSELTFPSSSWQQAWSRHDQQKSTAITCRNISCQHLFVWRMVHDAIQAWSLLVHCHSGGGLIAKCIEHGTTLMMAQSNRVPNAMDEHLTLWMICCLSGFYAHNVSNACFGGKMVWHRCCLWIYLDCSTVIYIYIYIYIFRCVIEGGDFNFLKPW